MHHGQQEKSYHGRSRAQIAWAVLGGEGSMEDEFPVYAGKDDQYTPAVAYNAASRYGGHDL